MQCKLFKNKEHSPLENVKLRQEASTKAKKIEMDLCFSFHIIESQICFFHALTKKSGIEARLHYCM